MPAARLRVLKTDYIIYCFLVLLVEKENRPAVSPGPSPRTVFLTRLAYGGRDMPLASAKIKEASNPEHDAGEHRENNDCEGHHQR